MANRSIRPHSKYDSPPEYNERNSGPGNSGVCDFIERCPVNHLRHPSTSTSNSFHRIPIAVVIPQQRSGYKECGFIAAYTPSLEGSGINQSTFLQFIHDCNKALTGNRLHAGVQVLSLGVGFTPDMIVMGVAAATQATAAIANKAAVRYKTNAVMDHYNETVFGPRSLYCMIMCYDPQLDEDYRLSSPLSQPQSFVKWTKMSSTFREPVAGKVQGPRNLPLAVAPSLCYDDRRQLKELTSRESPMDLSEQTKKTPLKKAKEALAALTTISTAEHG